MTDAIRAVRPAGSANLLLVRTYSGYSRRGLTYWSDGYAEGPHFPPVCQFLMQDPVTGIPFFPMDADAVATQIDPNGFAGNSIPMAAPATVESYAHAIEFMIEEGNTERLSILRHHWWWTSNQPRRKNPILPLSTVARTNMEAILDATTDATDYARMLRAELYRELGDFGKSLKELMPPFSRPRIVFAERLLSMNLAQDHTLSSYRWNPYP